MKKVTFLLAILLLISSAKAQVKQRNDDDNIASPLFGFLNSLNNQIDKFFEKEKLAHISREIGYFQIDLTDYLALRRELMDFIEKDGNNPDGNALQSRVQVLRVKLKSLQERLTTLKPLLNINLSQEIDKVIDAFFISAPIPSNVAYLAHLSNLDRLSAISPNDKKIIINEGESIYKKLVACLDMLRVIQAKISGKM